jgi:hypothetical protein
MNIIVTGSDEILIRGRRLPEENGVRVGRLPAERGLCRKLRVEDMLLHLAAQGSPGSRDEACRGCLAGAIRHRLGLGLCLARCQGLSGGILMTSKRRRRKGH